MRGALRLVRPCATEPDVMGHGVACTRVSASLWRTYDGERRWSESQQYPKQL
jgi:hypothetical protein